MVKRCEYDVTQSAPYICKECGLSDHKPIYGHCSNCWEGSVNCRGCGFELCACTLEPVQLETDQ